MGNARTGTRQPRTPTRTDLAGKQFGRWIVLRAGKVDNKWQVHWACRCTCGNEREVLAANLVRGLSISCGCYKREQTSKRRKVHGMARSAEYKAWQHLKQRCDSPSDKAFSNYGGRGITYCERWQSFVAFYEDMGSRPSVQHSIDRIDNDGPYSPENCRWASKTVQANNTRVNRNITHNGITKTFSEWLKEAPVGKSTVCRRLRKGWSIEMSMFSPHICITRDR